MSTHRLIPKLNDRDIISAFQKVLSKFPDLTLNFHDSLGAIPVDSIELFKKKASYNLATVDLIDRSSRSNWQWSREQSNASSDKLAFHWNAQYPPDRHRAVEISSSLDSALARPMADLVAEGSAVSLPYSTQREVLLALEGAVAQLVSDTASHRRELDEGYLAKEEKLAERLDQQRKDDLDRLASEKERQDHELSKQADALSKLREELAERQKQLDDRNNTHVRRDIRQSLLQLTQSRLDNFSVSNATKFQYYAVHAVCISALVALVAASLYYGTTATQATISNLQWALYAKSGVFAAVAVAVGTWYLKWLNRWLQRIADAEFRLQQFRLDIERASWLAETVLEWKSISQEPFPDLLAARLSSGLFDATTSSVDDPRTPAAHLAEALLGAASTAKVKIGNQELVFDRKGIDRLQKSSKPQAED